jgi:RNA-binding protein NOB1
VLSHADLCVLALAYALDLEAKSPSPTSTPTQDHGGHISENPSGSDAPQPDPELPVQSPVKTSPIPIFDDPSDEDDSEGEWITPSNVAVHKSRTLNLLPAEKCRSDAAEIIHAGCMTSDFAMQNVLLQMGLNLVSVDGKRIEKLKTWVLRCHACFKYVFF